ncbi:heme ABC transporter ATP-binding protein [Minwuia sp.]|uniref:heme ABC transporter ATP-binding protein n=1 Tax=Minwuia sp. TaxID=2493630 RepID=UPI003A9480B3
MDVIRAENLSVIRGGRHLLDRVSLGMAAGEVTVILGPNGAGKSTLLRCLSGTLVPDDGHVWLDGAPMAGVPGAVLATRRAVLGQESRLGFAFSVIEVIGLGRIPHTGRSDRAQNLRAIEAAMRATGLLHLAERDFTTLSGGEKQRVHLARTLAQLWPFSRDGASKILLLDEPTNNLDLAHQHRLLKHARALAAQGLAIGAVLHDPNLASGYADRVTVLNNGMIAASGTPAHVLTPELLSEVYGITLQTIGHAARGTPLLFAR